MGYDKGCLMGEIGFWVDFVGGIQGFVEVGFWSWCVDESAYRNSRKYKASFSFCYPLYPENYGISRFFRGKTYVL